MKKYFYSNGVDKFGPFSFDELKEMNISRDTLVWFQGMKDWKRADAIPELEELFELVPPALSEPKRAEVFAAAPPVARKYPPKSWLAESILVTVLCCLPFGIVGIVNASKVENRFYMGDYEQADELSAKAKKWTMLGLWFGVAYYVIMIIFYIIMIITDNWSSVSGSNFI